MLQKKHSIKTTKEALCSIQLKKSKAAAKSIFRELIFFCFSNFHWKFYWTDFSLLRCKTKKNPGSFCVPLLSRTARAQKLITVAGTLYVHSDPYGAAFVTRGGRKIAVTGLQLIIIFLYIRKALSQTIDCGSIGGWKSSRKGSMAPQFLCVCSTDTAGSGSSSGTKKN